MKIHKPPQSPIPSRERGIVVVDYMSPCRADTKRGTACALEALPGGEFCHVHEPTLQCGHLNARGQACVIPTGGRGPCVNHTASALGRRKVRRSPAERARRRDAREQKASEKHASDLAALALLDEIASLPRQSRT